jgi:hypothetical protein
MLNLYRLKELTLFNFCYSLNSLKSLAFLIPYFLFWYLIFDNVIVLAVEWLQSTQGLIFVSWISQDQELALRLFVDRSASLSIYLLVSVTLTPLFILLAANNQYSSDITRGAFRFLLMRATRAEIYLSRFIAVSLLVLICISITSVWASVQALIHKEDTLEAITLFGLQTFVLVFVYSLPFIAFMSMVSAFARSAVGSLCLGMMIYIVLVRVSFWFKSDIDYAIYLVPSGLKSILFDVNTENILVAISALLAYTLFYFLCGWHIFKRRDV